MGRLSNSFHILPQYQPLMRIIGLEAETIFTNPQIVAWRKLPDRENCTLDTEFDGKPIRLHIKRYQPVRASATPANDEVEGIQSLTAANIPTVPLVGWGNLDDGRSFVITQDLDGYRAADKLIEAGTPFESLLEPTADLAARLHNAALHHRDLYLCHFFARPDAPSEVRLIDAARVKLLGSVFTRQRWIVKDLAQFWYSTTSLPISEEQRQRWLTRYASQRGMPVTDRLRHSIVRKVAAIARHDARLKRAQPTRNISIPNSLSPEGRGRG
jgi:hypothetical protein